MDAGEYRCERRVDAQKGSWKMTDGVLCCVMRRFHYDIREYQYTGIWKVPQPVPVLLRDIACQSPALSDLSQKELPPSTATK